MHTIVNVERLPGRASAPRETPSRVPLLRRVLIWFERMRQRQALLTLDDFVLKDIGLTRADVTREHDKPFWQE